MVRVASMIKRPSASSDHICFPSSIRPSEYFVTLTIVSRSPCHLAFELVDGEDLRELIKRESMDGAEVMTLVGIDASGPMIEVYDPAQIEVVEGAGAPSR